MSYEFGPGIRSAVMAVSATVAVLSAGKAAAEEWELGASIAAEFRVFPDDPLYPDQLETFQPSIAVEPEIRWKSTDGKHQFVLIPFARLDTKDVERSHGDLREAYYRYSSDKDWAILIGFAKVFWGKTESRHLVDIINQDDAIEDIDGEDKLGQPMVQFSLRRDWGQFQLFLLPGFRERTFPGVDGRLRFDPPVSDERAIFESDAGRGHVDFAGRYTHYIGDFDIGLSAFHGTSREPRFYIAAGANELIPIYDQITQVGADIQYTKGAWLWKFEGIIREGQGSTFFASVAGFEYTLYQIFGKPWDLGLLSEHLYDGRDAGFVPYAKGLASAAPFTPSENDVFIGTRLALNDTQDTAILAGTIIDTGNATTAVSVEARRRLGRNWTVEFESRLLFNTDPGDTFQVFRRDNFMTVRLTRYF